MGPALPLILPVLATAAALVLERPRAKAIGVLVAAVLAPVLLLAHVWGAAELESLRSRPLALVAAVALAVALVAALARLALRHPALPAVLAPAVLPFRVPLDLGGAHVEMVLLPLLVVTTAGAIAYVVEHLRPVRSLDDRITVADPATRGLEWALAAVLVVYGARAFGSSAAGSAVEHAAGALVPFALLFLLVRRLTWTASLLRTCGAVLVSTALVLTAVGLVERATRHLLVDPDVVATARLDDAMRIGSAFFDPDLFGRFLAVAILVATAGLLWARRPREVAAAAVALAVLLAGLVVTLSTTSVAALAIGLAVLAALRWGARPALAIAGAGVVGLAAVLVLAGGGPHTDVVSRASLDAATSGRWSLADRSARLGAERPVLGHGAGSFEREYRRAERASAREAAAAARVTPLTVAAEQGVAGVAALAALLWFALRRLFTRARGDVARAAVAASFAAVLAQALVDGAFLEDPLTWLLLGAGSALAFVATRHRRPRERPAAGAPADERVAVMAG